MPWLCEATVRTWSSVVPGRTIVANRTGSTTSLTIISGGSSSSPSSTGGTAPSTLFSIGTQPASARPSRMAASTAGLPAHGTSSAPRASGSVSRACSVKVACGPRNASRGTVASLGVSDGVSRGGRGRRVPRRGRGPGPRRSAGSSVRTSRTWPGDHARASSASAAPSVVVRASATSSSVSARAAATSRFSTPNCTVPPAALTTGSAPSTTNPRLASATIRTKRSTSSTDGTSDARDPPQRSFGVQPCPATRRTASSHSATPSSSLPTGRRGSTTATTSSGTNSATRSSQTASTSTGAAVSIVRGVSRLEREKTVDRALGTAPRPVSTTSETSTGRAGDDRASSLTSTGSRDTGQTSCPSRPPWRPSRVARYRVTTASTPGALARGASRLVSSTRRSNSGGTGSRSAGSAEGTVVTLGTLTAGDGPAARGDAYRVVWT